MLRVWCRRPFLTLIAIERLFILSCNLNFAFVIAAGTHILTSLVHDWTACFNNEQTMQCVSTASNYITNVHLIPFKGKDCTVINYINAACLPLSAIRHKGKRYRLGAMRLLALTLYKGLYLSPLLARILRGQSRM